MTDSPQPVPPSRGAWIAYAFGFVAFVMGLAVSAWGLRQISNHYGLAGNAKLESLAADGADYDAVMIGSSVTLVGFVPEQFEERLRERGHALKAFNFGMSGLFGAEQDYYVRRILGMNLPKLRWLLIEVTVNFEPRLEEANWYTRREIDWVEPSQFAIVRRQVMRRSEPLLSRLETLWPYARHLALNLLNVGRGEQLPGAIARSESRQHPNEDDRESPAGHGRQLALKMKKAAGYKKHAARHERLVKELLEKQKHGPPRNNELLAQWREAAEARGVQVAFVIGPAMRRAEVPKRVRGQSPLRIFDFNDPRAYPALYDIDMHYDTFHLTPDGSRLFSQELAEKLGKTLDESPR